MLFASVFIPDFLLQALFAAKPELQREAIALIDGKPPLLKVMAANEKARKVGVEIGLGAPRARELVAGDELDLEASEDRITLRPLRGGARSPLTVYLTGYSLSIRMA